MIRRNFLKYSFALVLAMFGLAALAANNPPGPKPSETLIVTGNILESRALAEVAQFYAGCNVLLCHPEAELAIHRALAAVGRIPVPAWRTEATVSWTPPWATSSRGSSSRDSGAGRCSS